MRAVVEMLHFLVWGPWTLVLFLGMGMWFTIRSGFFQFFGLRCWWRETVGSLWSHEEGKERKEGRKVRSPVFSRPVQRLRLQSVQEIS